MDEQIRMNFPAMEAMAKAFQDGARELDEIARKVVELAGVIEDGALKGKAGAALYEKITTDVYSYVFHNAEKMRELEKDVREAMHQMQNADEIANSQF